MGRPLMKRSEVDYADVQGLVRFGYGKMKEASYALLRVKDAAAARAWLRRAPITNAVTHEAPADHGAAGRLHRRRVCVHSASLTTCSAVFPRSFSPE